MGNLHAGHLSLMSELRHRQTIRGNGEPQEGCDRGQRGGVFYVRRRHGPAKPLTDPRSQLGGRLLVIMKIDPAPELYEGFRRDILAWPAECAKPPVGNAESASWRTIHDAIRTTRTAG
jgi:hypothetical protein